jgi:lipid II:glycine glycyltransferase (peptidoglycan interpeptide bridge formation enzyme)
MKEIMIVQTLPEQQWRHFVDNHPYGNIFHTQEMYKVFNHALNHEPELWAAIRGDTILALMLPVRIHLLNGFFRRLTTRAIAYGSVLYTDDQDGQNGLAKLLEAYRQATKRKALFTELRNLFDLSAIQPILVCYQYSFVDHLNYLVDTSLPVEQVWSNINKSAQKNIIKALNKNQLEIVEVQDVSQIDTFYNILKKTYSSVHVPLADCSLFKAAFNILYPKGMVKFLLGRTEGQDIAASVVLLYKDVIYGWYRGFDRAYASYLPNDLMVWDTLKWGSEHNFHTFDFGGAGKPDEKYGPRQFKAKFGGKQVNYGRNIYIHASNLLRISEWGYKLFRRLPH